MGAARCQFEVGAARDPRQPASLHYARGGGRGLPGFEAFLALARLKQNRAADALAVYENVTVARGALTPSALAVHAAVLAANGRKDEAKSEISQLRTDQLLQEEKRLIENL